MSVYEASQLKRGRRTRAELAVIDDAIIAAVEEDKPVSLRGVYYRAVSAGVVGKTEQGYQLVGRELLKLRRSGDVSYWDIADGNRTVFRPTTYKDLDAMLADAAASYRRSLWTDTRAEVQIYSEKDAITGVVYPVTSEFDVPLGITRGYASETFAFKVAQSVIAAIGDDRKTFIYQLGDHDPSGVDAWRSFTERVRAFVEEEYYTDGWLHFDRIAVTPDQIASMTLPTRPTKDTDTRAAGFDGGSVEVDAIPANELRRIVRAAIEQHVDPDKLRVTRATEASEREILGRMDAAGLRRWQAEQDADE